MLIPHLYVFFFFFNDTATTEIYTLSLHDALPIYRHTVFGDARSAELLLQNNVAALGAEGDLHCVGELVDAAQDRKSTRLNSSHLVISYAVFCLKKKKKNITQT